MRLRTILHTSEAVQMIILPESYQSTAPLHSRKVWHLHCKTTLFPEISHWESSIENCHTPCMILRQTKAFCDNKPDIQFIGQLFSDIR